MIAPISCSPTLTENRESFRALRWIIFIVSLTIISAIAGIISYWRGLAG